MPLRFVEVPLERWICLESAEFGNLECAAAAGQGGGTTTDGRRGASRHRASRPSSVRVYRVASASLNVADGRITAFVLALSGR